MKTLVQMVVIFMSVMSLTAARGGLFNRFTSEMLSNLGFGGGGGRWGMSFTEKDRPSGDTPAGAEELLENIMMNSVEKEGDECEGQRCTANEHCCEDSVCVETNGVYGMCMKKYGAKLGKECRMDEDCEAGLVCASAMSFSGRTCQNPQAGKLQYNEDCRMSSDCDSTKGLCCQLKKAHRQKPRKVCLYFTDPLMCVGSVEKSEKGPSNMQYTAGEKRITGNVQAFKHLQ